MVKDVEALSARPIWSELQLSLTHVSQLRIIGLFEDLDDSDLKRVAASCSIRTHERHAQIIDEQDRTSDVFFILEGVVRINSYSPTGREVVFSEVGPGGMFGEFAAIDELPRSATILALSDCLLARMSAVAFMDLLRANSTVSIQLIEFLVSKIRRMSERVFEVSALAVRERVRRELLRLAADGKVTGQGVIIQPTPTHYEFAARIGTHREAVTREFNRLESERIIELGRRRIRIVNLRQLQQSQKI